MRAVAVVWAFWLVVWLSIGAYGLGTQDRLVGSVGFLAAVGWMIYGRWQFKRHPAYRGRDL